jgi:hypothetical protein
LAHALLSVESDGIITSFLSSCICSASIPHIVRGHEVLLFQKQWETIGSISWNREGSTPHVCIRVVRIGALVGLHGFFVGFTAPKAVGIGMLTSWIYDGNIWVFSWNDTNEGYAFWSQENIEFH